MLQRFAGRAPAVGRFLDLERSGTLGQSYLFVGPDGSGKELTALEIARLINCADPDACRLEAACESCRKALGFQHPDIQWICPAPASLSDGEVGELLASKAEDPFHRPSFAGTSEVLIGDPDRPGPLTIRSVLQFLRLKPFQGRHKVAIVTDAHRLRAGAANAFLKTLEEPPPGALILLLSSLRGAVLPTILSRCQRVAFEPYGGEELAALLRDLYDLPPQEAADYARAADGDARRAARSRLTLSRALRAWARGIVADLDAGRLGSAQIAAEMLHKGAVPADLLAEAADGVTRPGVAKELSERRDRAIQLCEQLHLHYSEILGRVARGDGWEPRLPRDAALIADLAGRRTPAGLLRDIAAVEQARREIDQSLNLGLVMAVLFQELSTHVRMDRAAARA